MAADLSAVSAAIARTAKPSAPATGLFRSAPSIQVPATGGNIEPAAGAKLPNDELVREFQETITQDIKRAVEQINALAEQNARSLDFQIDEGSGRTVITVRNALTNEIIRQIPPKELLLVAQSLGIDTTA
jgi:flagellar protein FlaG